ncbi:MAG: hypothetical protein IJQ21_05420, partial [Lachnospiraceae bacterium]|nr:hypothetical protein [Lachnospiraceae bacterium]
HLPHKAWAMLAGCCLIQGGSLGLIHNCRGIFYDPVINDLGFGMGAFSFYVLFFGVCSCLVLPVVGRIFDRIDERILLGHVYDRFGLGVSLTLGTLVTLAGFFLLLVDSAAVRLPAAFLYGFSMAMSAIMIAIAVRDVYGSRAYGELLSYSSMAATLGTSLNMCLIGFVVDIFGKQRGYVISLWGGIVITVLMGVLFIISIRGGRALSREGSGITNS